jgi:hypothetical protein
MCVVGEIILNSDNIVSSVLREILHTLVMLENFKRKYECEDNIKIYFRENGRILGSNRRII